MFHAETKRTHSRIKQDGYPPRAAGVKEPLMEKVQGMPVWVNNFFLTSLIKNKKEVEEGNKQKETKKEPYYLLKVSPHKNFSLGGFNVFS